MRSSAALTCSLAPPTRVSLLLRLRLPSFLSLLLRAVSPIAEKWNKIEYAYNRKEKKDHGEGGVIVGSALAGKKVLIIDDVITAGTAIKEAFSIIENEKATVAGVLLALDRQETTVDNTKQSAVQIISKTFNVPVISIVDILDIIKFLDGKLSAEEIEKVKEYRQKYAPENL